MTGDAVGLITNVLREHVSAGAKIHYLTGVVSVKCKACKEWIPDSGEYAGGFKGHVAREVDAALGGLTREPDRTTKCMCRHPVTDHDSGQRCHANSGSRHTPCACIEWRPRHRSRWVSRYSEDEQ